MSSSSASWNYLNPINVTMWSKHEPFSSTRQLATLQSSLVCIPCAAWSITDDSPIVFSATFSTPSGWFAIRHWYPMIHVCCVNDASKRVIMIKMAIKWATSLPFIFLNCKVNRTNDLAVRFLQCKRSFFVVLSEINEIKDNTPLLFFSRSFTREKKEMKKIRTEKPSSTFEAREQHPLSLSSSHSSESSPKEAIKCSTFLLFFFFLLLRSRRLRPLLAMVFADEWRQNKRDLEVISSFCASVCVCVAAVTTTLNDVGVLPFSYWK